MEQAIRKMTETNFCDGLQPCLVGGHIIILDEDWYSPSFGMYKKTEKCKVCGMKIKYSRYKWMPERIEYFDANGKPIPDEDDIE